MSNDKATRAIEDKRTSAASPQAETYAPAGWRKVLAAALAAQKRQSDATVARAATGSAANGNERETSEEFVWGLEYAIQALSKMKQPQPDLDEMSRAFEDSDFYFRGESPVQRAEAWAVWRAAWKAALPYRLTPAFEDELQAIARSVAH